MKHSSIRAAAPVSAPVYSEAEMAAARVDAYREGYGDGADAMQLERRGKPFLIEDEALDRWLTNQSH